MIKTHSGKGKFKWILFKIFKGLGVILGFECLSSNKNSISWSSQRFYFILVLALVRCTLSFGYYHGVCIIIIIFVSNMFWFVNFHLVYVLDWGFVFSLVLVLDIATFLVGISHVCVFVSFFTFLNICNILVL